MSGRTTIILAGQSGMPAFRLMVLIRTAIGACCNSVPLVEIYFLTAERADLTCRPYCRGRCLAWESRCRCCPCSRTLPCHAFQSATRMTRFFNVAFHTFWEDLL